MRKVFYVTGTRADFGLVRRTLERIDNQPGLQIGLLVTGMHLDPRFGSTCQEVEQSGLRIVHSIPSDLTAGEGFMARSIADVINGAVWAMERERPDILLVLGDRGEMLGGAIAALHLNIPIAHIHGGERSGTIDEPVRHAISKLAHIHFAATEQSAERLRRMGERQSSIHVVGAPGLDGLTEQTLTNRAQLLAEEGVMDDDRPLALLLFHPVVQEAGGAEQAELIVTTLEDHGFRIIGLNPNSDSGSNAIAAAMDGHARAGRLILKTHFPRDRFVSWMAAADVLIGNSSSGIIEAASMGTPVINVGTRQNLRERNANVFDVMPEPDTLKDALTKVLAKGRFEPQNIYGDGQTAERIARILADARLDRELLSKINAY